MILLENSAREPWSTTLDGEPARALLLDLPFPRCHDAPAETAVPPLAADHRAHRSGDVMSEPLPLDRLLCSVRSGGTVYQFPRSHG